MNFENSGIRLVAKGSSEYKFSAACICGMARGGTTAVAAGFEAAGIDMGSTTSNVKEDNDYIAVFHSKSFVQDFKSYISNRASLINSKSNNEMGFGFKFPEAYKRIRMMSETSNLAIVVVLRDPLAVALREVQSTFQPFDTTISNKIKKYRNIIDTLQNINPDSTKSRIIMVSYEKILSNPRDTFLNLFESLGINGDLQNMANSASSVIQINNQGYLQESNLSPKFNIDKFSTDGFSGWCYFSADHKRKPVLSIRYKHHIIDKVTCNRARPDVLKAGHPTGSCGFFVDFNSAQYKNIDFSKLKIFIADSDFELPLH